MSTETSTITTDDGVALHVRVDGPADAPPVLLSNSLGTDLHMWDALADHLGDRVRLIRYDKRGHGRSGAPSKPETNIERLSRDALAVMDGLGVEKARFCGLSIGGMTGLWLGAHVPERFSCLAICNSSAYTGVPEVWEQRLAMVREGGMDAIVDSVLERWFTPEFRAGSASVVGTVRAMLLGTTPEGYMACSAAVRDVDLRADLPSVALPTLVVVGAKDAALTPAMGEAIVADIPGARLHTIADAAHVSNIERAEEFNAVVGQFLLEDGQI